MDSEASLARRLVLACTDYSRALYVLDAEHPDAHAARERILAEAQQAVERILQEHLESILCSGEH